MTWNITTSDTASINLHAVPPYLSYFSEAERVRMEEVCRVQGHLGGWPHTGLKSGSKEEKWLRESLLHRGLVPEGRAQTCEGGGQWVRKGWKHPDESWTPGEDGQ